MQSIDRSMTNMETAKAAITKNRGTRIRHSHNNASINRDDDDYDDVVDDESHFLLSRDDLNAKQHEDNIYRQTVTTVARLNAIRAPHAADWKATVPSSKQTTLSDSHYRIAAYLNLGLPMSDLPSDCHGCGMNKVRYDPYHYLSCSAHKRKEITMGHDLLVKVVHQYNQLTGGTGNIEPHDMDYYDGRRPDLQLLTNNEHILSDVQITNPLCPSHIQGAATRQLHAAEKSERIKINKYAHTAYQHHATFVPFVMEATGGMSASAQRIYEKIILASRDDARSLWPHEIIASEFRGAIAVALQTRNAMTMIAGRNLALGRAAVGCAA